MISSPSHCIYAQSIHTGSVGENQSVCFTPLPTQNLGDVLRNAISSPAITLTISWWSEAEALWDIDSPHPETVSIIG